MRSIADELNITIAETCGDAEEDAVTFRAEAGHWQDTEFTLRNDGHSWTLDVSTPTARDCEHLVQSEQALVHRFEDADLGRVQLRVRRRSAG